MSYQYDFDDTSAGDLRLARRKYEVLHRAYRLLRDELHAWNQRVGRENSAEAPYRDAVADLDGIIEWGECHLRSVPREIVVRGISVGSIRYAKAALTLDIHHRRHERAVKSAEGWPDAALRSLDDAIERTQSIADVMNQQSSEVLWQLISRNDASGAAMAAPPPPHWDVFISYASEDKDDFVRPLARALQDCGMSVWFDELTLKVGDSLRRSIDRGLASSRFGVVVISPHFLSKEWPQKELDGLTAREVDGTKVILPVWHDLSADQVRRYSPTLADRVATRSSDGLPRVVADLVKAVGTADSSPASRLHSTSGAEPTPSDKQIPSRHPSPMLGNGFPLRRQSRSPAASPHCSCTCAFAPFCVARTAPTLRSLSATPC